VGAGLGVVEIRDAARWNRAVLAAPRADLLQSWEWGELKRRSGGWRALRVAAADGDDLVAGAQILWRPVLGARFLYAPRGPWWRDARGLDALVRWLRRRGWRSPLLRADPPLAEAGELTRRGFRPAPRQFQPRATIVVDLSPTPEQLMARFDGQVRYNARLAERKGVEVAEAGAEAVAEFWNLGRSTAGRKGFEWRAQSYFAELMRAYGDAARIFLARRDGQALAGALVVAFGDTAYYLYGASGGDRSVKPAELVQYRAMLWARGRGMPRYDMWGVPGHPTPENPLYGVYRFKSGFGGKPESYVGALDLPLIPLVPWGAAEALALKLNALRHGEGFRLEDHLA
jgi:lipid II:glycine glycyltransferase (peptidoglycan interpeptide bridge formation enzyme)